MSWIIFNYSFTSYYNQVFVIYCNLKMEIYQLLYISSLNQIKLITAKISFFGYALIYDLCSILLSHINDFKLK